MVILNMIERLSRCCNWGGLAVVLAMALSACTSSHGVDGIWSSPAGAQMKAGETDPDFIYSSLYTAATEARLAGKQDESFVLLEQAMAAGPDRASALYDLGLLCMEYTEQTGRPSKYDVDSLLERAALLAPNDLQIQLAYAKRLTAVEKYEAAIAQYQKVLRLDENPEYLSNLFAVYHKAGQPEKSLEVLDRMEVLEGPDDDIYWGRYGIYLEQTDTLKAFEAIDSLCASHPGDLYFQVMKASSYHSLGMNDKALALYKKVLATDPQYTFGRASLIIFYESVHETAQADSLFRVLVFDPQTEASARNDFMQKFYMNALKTKMDTAEVMPVMRRVMDLPQENADLATLSVAYLYECGYSAKEAAFLHEKILEVDPTNKGSRFELILQASREENYDRIHQLCLEGQQSTPEVLAFYYYDAASSVSGDGFDYAAKVLEEGLTKADTLDDLNVLASVYSFLGDCYQELDRLEETLAAYERSVELDPDNISCLNNYAYFLTKIDGDMEKAEQMSKKTIEAEPKNSTFLDTYAWILYKMERYTQARIYIDQTLKYTEETSENATLFDHAGDIYLRCDEVELAVAYWKKALKITDDKAMQKVLRKKIRYRKI